MEKIKTVQLQVQGSIFINSMHHHFLWLRKWYYWNKRERFFLFFTYLKHAVSGHCPICGADDLFSSWSRMKDKCSNCNTWFIEQYGNNWFFPLFIDRGLFIFPIIVGYFFNMRPESLIVLCLLLMVMFVIATLFRPRLCLALELFIRQKFQKDSQLIHK